MLRDPSRPAPAMNDALRFFLFEHLDIRGALVRLNQSWQAMTQGRDYAPAVARMLGEMCAASAVIAANLKRDARLTFQLRGNGAVNLLVLDWEASPPLESLRMRGMARAQARVPDAPPRALLGDGRLVLTLTTPDQRDPYQSHVPLQGESVAAIFEHYLTLSEQTPTRLWLAADEARAAALFLQKLPDADARDADGWNRVQLLAGSVRDEELLTLPSVELLTRLFAEEDVRVFDPRPIAHHCPEDWDKVRGMLHSLGRDECEAIVREHGEVHVHDDICNRDYRFSADDIAFLFEAPPPTRH
jgi:molecular chaperone Hsp33